jgi:carbon starvation protein
MFGIANQLLAGIALCVGTTLIVNLGRARLAWVTLLPLSFVSTTTLTAGYKSITDNFMPLSRSADPSVSFQGQLNVVLTIIMMTCMIIILFDSMLRWRKALSSEKPGGVPVAG